MAVETVSFEQRGETIADQAVCSPPDRADVPRWVLTRLAPTGTV